MNNKTRQRSSSKQQDDYENKKSTSPNPEIHPKIISAVRIEQRLLNHQKVSKRKLETLKKNLEQEELKTLQSKPKILNKSKVLAEKAERRLTAEPRVMQSTPSQKTKENSTEIAVQKPVTPNFDRKIQRARSSKRTKSLFNLTVIEKNEAWTEAQKKVKKTKKNTSKKSLNPYDYLKKTLRNLKDPQSTASYFSSPSSLEVSEIQGPRSRAPGPICRQIAPYQVKVSFKCGIDLNSFFRRAK